MDETEIKLNYETMKEQIKSNSKRSRQLLKNIIRLSDRETVIKVLKELKIIKNELNPETDRLELMARAPVMKTECNKKIHVVGKGTCGLMVVQVKTDDGWRFGKLITIKLIEMFGSKELYMVKDDAS